MLEKDGWAVRRTAGSHRRYTHPTKRGVVTVAEKPSDSLKPETESSILQQAGLLTGGWMDGYVVVFEGDGESGYPSYSPDLPGVVAAAATREETEALMLQAMAAHITLMRELGLEVPEPATNVDATVLSVPAA